MVFCKRIELSITDRESYGLIYLPSSDLENRNHCLHVALIGCGWGRRGERGGVEGGGGGWRGVLNGILERGVPPWPSNPDLV